MLQSPFLGATHKVPRLGKPERERCQGMGGPGEATVEKVQCPPLWGCSASLQGEARGEKEREGRV